jgi:hypothetical protein
VMQLAAWRSAESPRWPCAMARWKWRARRRWKTCVPSADRGRARPRRGRLEPHGVCHLALRQSNIRSPRLAARTHSTRRPCWPRTHMRHFNGHTSSAQ